MITKAEVYKTVIDIQKSSGQGLTGIVRVMGENSHYFNMYLDELIEEGLVECYENSSTMGHPESNRWYMPSKGYNLWEDGMKNEGNENAYLTYVRFYLGQIDLDEEPEDRENLAKWLKPSAQLLIQNPDFIKGYSKWLKRNKEQLDIMTNLDDFYDEPTVVLTEDDINWVKTKSWYEKNKSISSCLKSSIKGFDTDKERLSLTKRIIELYKSDTLKYKDDLKKALKEIEDHDSNILRRKRVNKWMESLDVEKLIQECI
jgi:hypothetical protein